ACGAAGQPGPPLLRESASVTSAAANPVAVSPLPGTPDASPVTQISFLGPRGTRVARVRVVGSRSGVHAGILRAYSTATGESFIPARPFREGERVTVRARVRRDGLRERLARTTFTVAHQVPVRQKVFPVSHGDPRAVQHFE